MVNFKELLFRIKSVFIIRPLCVSHKPQSSKKLLCFEFCLREKMSLLSMKKNVSCLKPFGIALTIGSWLLMTEVNMQSYFVHLVNKYKILEKANLFI